VADDVPDAPSSSVDPCRLRRCGEAKFNFWEALQNENFDKLIFEKMTFIDGAHGVFIIGSFD